jgi:hypothetical protein
MQWLDGSADLQRVRSLAAEQPDPEHGDRHPSNPSLSPRPHASSFSWTPA